VVQIPNILSIAEWQVNNDRRAGTHGTSYLQMSAHIVGAGAHVGKSESFSARGLRISHARSGVSDLENEVGRMAANIHADDRRLGVTRSVADRLLGNPQKILLNGRRQALFGHTG